MCVFVFGCVCVPWLDRGHRWVDLDLACRRSLLEPIPHTFPSSMPLTHTTNPPHANAGGTALFRSDTAFENAPVAGQEPAERPSKELLDDAVKIGDGDWDEGTDGEVSQSARD